MTPPQDGTHTAQLLRRLWKEGQAGRSEKAAEPREYELIFEQKKEKETSHC